ncbi:MAG: response regulator [bacterium]|nr:response regulator [bacterium]
MHLKLFIACFLLTAVLWVPVALEGQSAGSAGFKYFKNYSPNDYDHQPQNWSILQDRRGVIYVGNHGGVLEFDGVSWRLIHVPNRTVRSMAIDDTGTIYIGGKNEIGFLAPDSNGSLQYVSLLPHLDKNKRNFSNVWRTHSTKEGIYFRTSKFLFRWDSREMKVWETGNTFNASFTCGGKYFVHQRKIGLMQMAEDSLRFIPGKEKFAHLKIYMMVRYDTQRLLIGTSSNGFFLYDGIDAVTFPTGADDYLKKRLLYHGIRLSRTGEPGGFALATIGGGLVILDSKGRLKRIFNKASGLPGNNVSYVFEDFQGNLWTALDKGISKLEYASPFSIYNENISNLPGIILSAVTHRGVLYAGTTTGLYSLTPPAAEFHPVPGITSACWSLLSTGNFLLAATSKGVFQVKNNKMERLISTRSDVLLHSAKDKNRTWAGTVRGLVSLYSNNQYSNNRNGEWTREYRFDNIDREITTIVEDKKGNLWLGTLTKGVLKVDFPVDGAITNPVVKHYDTSHGLPGEEIRVFKAAGHVMFATEIGIFRFNEKAKAFIPDSTLGEEFAGGENGRGVFRIVEDKDKNIWIHSKSRNIQAVPRPDGTFFINKKPFLRIPLNQVNTIYPEPTGKIIWFAANDALIRYDTAVKKKCDFDFSTLIRQVLVNGKPVFSGFENKTGKRVPIIDYKNRNLRFRFAAPFFEGETGPKYQYLLEGYDHHWSAWSGEAQKDYIHLDSGLHTFRVRAENIYQNISREDVFQFKILPPWYKTWWVFLLYGIFSFLLVFFIVKWRSRRLVLEKQRLEQVVRDRTKEIAEKSEQLKEMDKVKSRFFANISHEFRTPLTLIMGPLEQMLSGAGPDAGDVRVQKKQLNLMLRNSRRLLNLINQLLDLSKFESGKMTLQAAPQNIISFIKGITASFETAAEQHELDLRFNAGDDTIILFVDPEKLEKVMSNLLSNAVKFTPPGGRISVSVTQTASGSGFPTGSVEISVSDTGIGIPGDQLQYIFEHFYQVGGSNEHKYKGSGIGLSLARELVMLHRGTIDVRSSEGPENGTEFIVRLPLGKEHLEPAEIGAVSQTVAETFKPINSDEDEQEEEEFDMETAVEEKNIVLIVEDNADVRSYVRGSLEPLYTVVETVDGREGIGRAREIIPDLIISDVMMPGADGYELCRELKKDIKTSHIPIVLLTARASEESTVRGLETGADDYITKPFNTKMLLARIKNLIELRRRLHMDLDREMTLRPVEVSVSGIDKEFIKDLKEVIEANISDPEFNVEELSRRLYLSRATLYRKIQALSGKAPTDFIRSYRLKRAAELLKSNFGSVTEVAFEVGFSSRTYFTKCFKEKFHQLPSDYQGTEASKKF